MHTSEYIKDGLYIFILNINFIYFIGSTLNFLIDMISYETPINLIYFIFELIVLNKNKYLVNNKPLLILLLLNVYANYSIRIKMIEFIFIFFTSSYLYFTENYKLDIEFQSNSFYKINISILNTLLIIILCFVKYFMFFEDFRFSSLSVLSILIIFLFYNDIICYQIKSKYLDNIIDIDRDFIDCDRYLNKIIMMKSSTINISIFLVILFFFI